MDLRCPSRLHGVQDGDHFEVKCQSKHCGAGGGVTVLHYFDLRTGELVRTRKFSDPNTLFAGKEARRNAALDDPTAVRPA